MSKNVEVVHRILALLETIEEGLQHTQKQLAELRFEEAFSILEARVVSIANIERALLSMENDLPENKSDPLVAAVNSSLRRLVNSYGKTSMVDMEEQIRREILPRFLDWKEEVERILKPRVIS